LERAQGRIKAGFGKYAENGIPYGAVFVMRQAVCLAVGFFLGRTTLFDCLPSFAVAFAAAVPGKYLLTAAAGGVAGCMTCGLPVPAELISAAAIVAAAAINRAADAIVKGRENTAVAFASSALCCAVTGITVQAASGFTLDRSVIYLCEAALSGSASYFFTRCRYTLPLLKSTVHFSTAEMMCFSICGCIMLTALSTVSIGLFIPAGVLAALLAISASYILAETGGAIAGICAGVSLGLAGAAPGVSGCFAIAGLCSGLFSRIGQTSCAIAFTAVTAFFAVISGTGGGVAVMVESALAAIIFILIPRRYLETAKRRFVEMQTESSAADSGSAVLGLVSASNAVTEIAGYIEKITGGESEQAKLFTFISDILTDTARELGRAGAFSHSKAKRIAGVLRSFGIRVTGISCTEGGKGRLMVTALTDRFDEGINKTRLAVEAGRACGCELCIPSVFRSGNGCVINFSQEAELRVRVGTVQRACDGNEFCGDFFEIFSDGHGRQIMVLSDGMGTGGAAAVDASMAAELFSSLVRSGLSFDCALRLVNTALLSKGTDESLSTLDVACIDLYSGRVEFMKAGAAATFVRKGKKAAVLELAALPAGILSSIGFEKARSDLASGDIIVMVSDGALSGSDEWILNMLRGYEGESARELAENIARFAQEKRGGVINDDLTVLCAILE
jgi:hypothetical protein